jgi:formylglycine-generating enzyme required for sulfatase activity
LVGKLKSGNKASKIPNHKKSTNMKPLNLFKKVVIVTALLFSCATTRANNLVITGTSVSGSNITFNISWDNSWSTNIAPNNWDASWVFVKYQDCSTRQWYHAGLSTIAGDHTAGSPLQVDPTTDGMGVFIRRSAFGGGSTGTVSVTLKMTIAAGTYNYKVFGVEMVNIPQGNFDVGDATSSGTFNSITINSASQSGGLAAVTLGGSAVAVPATYPMGYNALYSMKYEITQEQYMEFLNTLTYDQQKTRTANDPISAAGTFAMSAAFNYRNGIIIATPGNNNILPAVYACDATAGTYNNTNDGQNIPADYLSWGDLSAYLDWAALRPMSDLEYEKICRGTMSRVAGEYPWGSTNLQAVYSTSVNSPLTAAETYTPIVNGLCTYGVGSVNTGYGPTRAGMYATGSSGRESAGATYYGVMEMGGNCWERAVSVENASGTAFIGNNGDGTLAVNGDPNQASWPAATTATGTGYRGGCWYNAATYVRTSDRTYMGTTDATRSFTFGGRGVR